MKKWMTGIFFLILLLPGLLGMAEGGESVSEENRELAEFPQLTAENFENIPAELEAYINDHAPWRNEIMDVCAGFDLMVFQSIDNQDVIRGRDGWLFYKGNSSVADAMGMGVFAEPEMASILEQLLTVRSLTVENPEDFVLYIAPNKEIVYRQYVPEAYDPVSGTSRALELVKYIREHSDLKVVYPLEELKEAAGRRQIYYKTDTHWNRLGGFVGTQLLMKELGLETARPEEVSVTELPKEPGDLAKLAHLPDFLAEDTQVEAAWNKPESQVSVLEDNPRTGLIEARAEGAQSPKRLLMLRDSFADYMASWLMREYAESVFVKWEQLDQTPLNQLEGDVVVYELVERNLGRIMYDLDRFIDIKSAQKRAEQGEQ
ncbi:MAG: hypothetical protein Q4C73_00120 [Eubacteriales bacterium]|nr:hypothetical protein [Eubacteriales bacterium]